MEVGDHLVDRPAGQRLQLVPEMASLRLQVLAFVRAYCVRWGEGPSYGEIAEATGTNRTRVKKAVRRLVETGYLLRQPGVRGLMLPTQQEQALSLLLRMGWTINRAQRFASAPALPNGVTNQALQPREVLDYNPAQ